MRKMPNILIVSIVILFLGFLSCKSDEEKLAACSLAWASELQDELNDISTASAAYFNDPSTANCTAYTSAYEAYIDALEPYGQCSALTGQNRTAWEQAIQDARESLDTICD
jgi:hypothetical protein